MVATLKDIARVLVAKHQLKQRDAEVFVNAVVDTILEGLQADRIVKIKGFGTFKLTAVRERESVNVNTGERIIVSGHDKISFTPDAVMRDMVNKPFAHFDTVVLADGVNFDDMPEVETENEDVQSEIVEAEVEDIKTETEDVKTEVEDIKTETEDSKPEIEENKTEIEDIKPEIEMGTENKTPIEKIEVEEKEMIENVNIPAEEEASEEQNAEDAARDELIKANGFIVPSDDDDDDKNKKKTDCKKVFILYAIVANILFAAIAFVLGYLCCSNNWLSLHQKAMLVPEQEPIEIVVDSAELAKQARIDSIKKAAAGPVVKKEEEKKPATTVAANEKTDAKPKAVAEPKAPEQKKAEQKPVAGKQETKENVKAEAVPGIPDQTPYINNARVRTGAYYIVGTKTTVKVRAGQTLQSLSKFYLGAGMECYIEAYNGGLTSVKEGQSIKIPELKLKKSVKK